ncbi:ribonuclease HI [Garciella nitratireducens]|uniref:ribonuclease HI n=1 Tax=Garciella nitratireducens TaxID=218205 RepID=UPI000E06B3B1|nr:ribonuclease HI [Garciella nitratireducens]RBP41589.1 ribonuclease HI [Garciella nitratireducens]
MKKIIMYTDGGCRDNGNDINLGAIGIVLIYPEKKYKKEYKKGFKNTTNNKMELLAVITGLKMLKEPCEVTIYSDSAYVVNAFQQKWIDSWRKKGWKRGKDKELKNKKLWMELYQLTQIHQVEFRKVKGHAQDEYNNRCDELVNLAMDEMNKRE